MYNYNSYIAPFIVVAFGDAHNLLLFISLSILRNMMKSDSLYNYGMKPLVYSSKDASSEGIGWVRSCDDVAYFKTRDTYKHRKGAHRKNYYALTFTYTFTNDSDTVYFAHCFPYTYTDLNMDLKALMDNEKTRHFLRRRVLSTTLAGNRTELLTVTAPCATPEELMNRNVVFISARVHPGETNSSFMLRGFLDYITSDNASAQKLREKLIFKIIPMLNPDGVVHGNYRCSLAGCDLNRRWNKPVEDLHPAIYKMKEVMIKVSQSRIITAFIDLHGHSRKKSIFTYGCVDPSSSASQSVEELLPAYLLPYLLYRCFLFSFLFY
jgi:murein tripeptide amidase MpaA